MFKVGDESESVTADRDGSRGRILTPETVYEQAIHPYPGNTVLSAEEPRDYLTQYGYSSYDGI